MSEQQVADYRLGTLVGDKYRIIRRLGEGGMGAVYEARHEAIGRRFAVKFMHAELSLNSSILARFEREAQAAGALESENIAAVTDFGRAADGSPYIVMEYLQGEDLSRLLGRVGPLPVPRAANLVIQACRGLEAAHAAGIVHRDLKPENLFVIRRGDGTDLVKVLDFGIAKLRRAGDSSATKTGTAMGTPFYMPPEQARGEKELDHRADVYALGVILFEILSGQRPHQGDGYNAILYKILTQTPARLETLRRNLPAGLADVVHKAMAGDAVVRYADVAELMAALEPFAGGATRVLVDNGLTSPALGAGSATIATPTEVGVGAGASLGAQTAPATSLDASVTGKAASRRWVLWLALAAAALGAGTWVLVSGGDPTAAAPDSATPTAPTQPKPASDRATAAAEPSVAPEPTPAPVVTTAARTPGRPSDTASPAGVAKAPPTRNTVARPNPTVSAQKPARPAADARVAPNSQRDPFAP